MSLLSLPREHIVPATITSDQLPEYGVSELLLWKEGVKIHNHRYSFLTRRARGHRHRMCGTTSCQPNIRGHRHRYFGSTSVSVNHIHFYGGVTGPAVYVQGRRHYHRMIGSTTFNLGHSHSYQARTRLARDLCR
ncbi:hypothetical protein GJ688_12545 [Heliobacillus mobilis]|uniref:Uncharacterized protein n=1 Tax=Heliobacterium mobile TaxID=28064 RepID=A0A6I3SLH3_HELMO|nr:hypothetical protein [Heliobacterium mobile]